MSDIDWNKFIMSNGLQQYISIDKKNAHQYSIIIELPLNRKNTKLSIGQTSYLKLVSGFSSKFSIKYNKMLATIIGESGDGSEYIKDYDRLYKIIRGNDDEFDWWYCSDIEIAINDNYFSDFYDTVGKDIVHSLSDSQNPLFGTNFINKVMIDTLGIGIQIETLDKIKDLSEIEKFCKTESGRKLYEIFHNAVGRKPNIVLVPYSADSEYLEIEDFDDIKNQEPLSKKLLDFFDVNLSAVKANKVLIENEILEEVSNGGSSKYKAFTQNGLYFGENIKSGKNTKPMFYKNKFEELVETYFQ